MGQDKISHYEIADTGTETKNGPVVYSREQVGYMKLFGTSFAPQIDYMSPEYQAPLKDRTNEVWEFTSKRIVGKNPVTFNLTLYFEKSRFNEMNKLFKMADNFGLKRIKGGNGIIENLPFAETDGSAHFIITRLSPSESASRTNVVKISMSGVFV